MNRRIWRRFDFILMAAIILLIIFGVAMIHSATINTPGLEGLATRQAVYALGGLVLVPIVAAIDYRFYEHFARPIYAITLLLLGVVFVLGQTAFGAQRSISLGLFPVQPSELSKILLVLVLAQFLAAHEEQLGSLYIVICSLLLVAIPAAMIYMQPDLGTSLVLIVIWLAMILIAGLRLRHLALFGLASGLVMPVFWLSIHDYMRHRLLVFLNPAADPEASYNVGQALISIGSGGIWGKEFASGSQSQLHFLRVRHTDFIFSVIAEEMGLVGSLLLFALLIVVIMRIVRAAQLARDTFGRLIACGIATIIFFQSVVNVGMNLNLLPVTGTPLPFVSQGGSSMVTLLIGVGLVQSVVMRHRKIEF
ncbi:MAG: FtsW/RodA/SpoVE family cell cycle protein [Chloroflexota bacterium]|nr:FtsW/RodA/SpoVE family cell cycle protein [Chloroflexota bacterium]